MKMGMIVSTNEPETAFNALRLGNFAIQRGDEVAIFLVGKGVELDRLEDERFNVRDQAQTFLQETPASIFVLARDSLDAFPRTRDCLLEEGGRYRCRERNYQMVSALTPENVVMVVGTATPDAMDQLLDAYVASPLEAR